MNGHTSDLSPKEKQDNELATLRQFVQENPGNQYWNNRLIALEAKIEADWITEWLCKSHITIRHNPPLLGRYVPTDQAARLAKAKAESLDENGNLRPYSSFPRRSGTVVNLEDEKTHSWILE